MDFTTESFRWDLEVHSIALIGQVSNVNRNQVNRTRSKDLDTEGLYNVLMSAFLLAGGGKRAEGAAELPALTSRFPVSGTFISRAPVFSVLGPVSRSSR